MKKNTSFLLLMIMFIVFVIPGQSFASNIGGIENNTPPSSQISSIPNYSAGFVILSTIGGSCSISKLSSSSVEISGTTTCSPASPAVTITLKLQAYYNGDWQTLASISKTESGTSVSLSRTYSVTPGYYYRVYATHSVADGSKTYSYSNSILIN